MRAIVACLLTLKFLLLASSALGQESAKTDDQKPADPDTGESTIEEKTLGILPQPFKDYGVKFAVTYIGETLGNPSGGYRQGAIYEGRLNVAVDADLQKVTGLEGLSFHANMFQIHGEGLSRNYLQNYMVVSGIEALPSTRLYEMWLEKKWGDALSLRVGQLAADTEFMTAKYTDVFTNSSLGWPAIFALNMPSGGPSPPLAALGARLRANLSDNWTIAAAIFDGDAAGPGSQDPQILNPNGVNFRINDPPLVLGEFQYIWNGKKGDPGLAGKFKVGGWRHFGQFGDERFTTRGVSLGALPSSMPATLIGDYGIYGVLEQKLIRVGNDSDRGIGIFFRGSFSPPERNLIDYYADGGIEFVGLQDNRPDDKLGVAFGYTHVSSNVQELDADFQRIMGPTWPRRTSELLLTSAYQYQIRDGWTLQPNFQYIMRPGGGASDPFGANPGKVLKDAEVFGVRTVLKF